jgi:hypothetical protein
LIALLERGMAVGDVVEGTEEASVVGGSAVVGSIMFMGCNTYSTPIGVSNLIST